jgi:hypothetical protein
LLLSLWTSNGHREVLLGVAGQTLTFLLAASVTGRFKTSHEWALQNQQRYKGS